MIPTLLVSTLLASAPCALPQEGDPASLPLVGEGTESFPIGPIGEAIGTDSFSVGHLTGDEELDELYAAVLNDKLAASVRRASLDSYSEILESGKVKGAAESLARSMMLFVEPTDDPRFKVEATSRSELSVTGTQKQREWAYSFLDATRRYKDRDILLEFQVKYIRLPEGVREGLLPSGSGVSLTREEAAELEKKLRALPEVEFGSAPKVTTHVGAPAEISVIEQIAYIKDYESTILPDLSQLIVDPVIDVLQDGFTLRVRGAYVAQNVLKVRTDFTLAAVNRPIPQVKRKVTAEGGEVTIQVPEVKTVKANAAFEVKDEAVIALSAVDPGFDGEPTTDVILLISTDVLESFNFSVEVK